MLTAQAADTAKEIPLECRTDCESDYGVVLGESPLGVTAYSNCNDACVIFEPHRHNEIYTGIKWQCVEFARRWLLQQKAVVFGDVDIAADIWNLQQVQNPVSKESFEFSSVVNGANLLPQQGDLLIYGEEFLGTGHVAVVTGINNKLRTIQVAEQNYDNAKWQNNFAREITYTYINDQYWLLDQYLVGWKRVIKNIH